MMEANSGRLMWENRLAVLQLFAQSPVPKLPQYLKSAYPVEIPRERFYKTIPNYPEQTQNFARACKTALDRSAGLFGVLKND
jgi:hypothetical protein